MKEFTMKFIFWVVLGFTIIAVVLIFPHIHAFEHSLFSKCYCPNCYKPATIRIDLQKKCEYCGYNFYLDKTEIPH